MNKRKKIAIIVPICLLFVIGLTFLIGFIPTFNLKTENMILLSGKWVNVYYETEEAAAKDVFNYLEQETESLTKKLGFTEKQDIYVYIYDNQYTMQTKKYGYFGPMFDLGWYIGDNIGTNVILTSPANPGPEHDYDNNKYASLHEVVHALVSVKNKNIDLWLTEGVALYLSNGQNFYKELLDYSVPSYANTCSNSSITFSNSLGYAYANIYIEYLDITYGWDKVLELIETEDYQQCFGKSKRAIYDEWINYLYNYPEQQI